MAEVLSAMLDSSQYDLLAQFCSRHGELAFKRLCAPPDCCVEQNALAKTKTGDSYSPYMTCLDMHVVTKGSGRGLLMYVGWSDGRINSMHFHVGAAVWFFMRS
jgi:hypothetical protein